MKDIRRLGVMADGVRYRALAFAVLVLVGVSPLLGEPATITEWRLPAAGSGPAYLAPDGLGGFWFTQQDAARLAHFDPATGTLREWQDPSPFFDFGISVDEAGFVWVAAWSRALLRFDPRTDRFHVFDMPTAFPLPFMVHAEREVCTTQFRRAVVACLDPSSRVWSEWRLPPGLDSPEGLLAGRDGVLWIGIDGGRRIARLDRSSGLLTTWRIPGAGEVRLQLAEDLSGRIWVPLIEEGALARLDPEADRIEVFPLPVAGAEPFAVEVDRLGRVWFTEAGVAGNAIGRLDLSRPPGETFTIAREAYALEAGLATSHVGNYGVEAPVIHHLEGIITPVESLESGGLHEWPLPTAAAGPSDLLLDDRGRVLFTEYTADALGMLAPRRSAIAAAVLEALDRLASLVRAAGPPGAPGLLAKLERVALIVAEAEAGLASGDLSQAEHRRELERALRLLAAFEDQLTAKISNGRLGEPEASELPPLVTGVDHSIRLLTSTDG